MSRESPLESLPILQLTATTVVALLTGFFIGQKFSNRKDADAMPTKKAQAEEADSDSDLDEAPVGKVDVGKYGDNFKMVLVVRTDLGMTKGKVAAQCGHATLACYKSAMKSNPEVLRIWERTGQAKVALKCDSEDKMLDLQAIALSLNLTAQSICDAGRTQIAAGSRTVLGIGPGPVELVDQVTGHLKLL
ncbi:peptidyl-tRNA hydrolase [Lichtheimia ornata]|uniref:peptidyl-tRNA hydrolase n=1 Tax=Lichtheimia ornata TaxID=688661 RepID=A0AAD7UTP6_9FUNG|nr:peptidyl-tRNA hydrolase [Lichtheimia ornata]KAJ8653050.1 peptidyl-tRNA hydrolase [Lichtheimia ornata]